MLTYHRSNDLVVIGYFNIDFGGYLDDQKSTSRYVFMMAGIAISWKSIKQSIITISNVEAKCVINYEFNCEAF